MSTVDKTIKLGFLLTATDKMSAIIDRATKKSSKSLSAFERNTAKFSKGLMKAGGWMTGMGVAIGNSILNIAKNTASYGDSAYKTAQKIGMNVEAWQELAYAGKQANIDMESLSSHVLKFNKTLAGVFSGGNREVSEGLKSLGISVVDVTGKFRKQEDILKDIADVFESAPDSIKKTEIATKLFGKSGAEMIPFLNMGSKSIEALAEEARSLGLIMDNESALAAQTFNSNLTRLTASLEGLKFKIGSALIPQIDELVLKMVLLIKYILLSLQPKKL